MTIRKARSAAAIAEPAPLELSLQHSRRLSIAVAGDDDLLEIRGVGDALELRIRLTAEGPVLQLESLRLSLKAAQELEVNCETLKVTAQAGLELRSEGSLRIRGREDVQLDAEGDVRVTGALIHLN